VETWNEAVWRCMVEISTHSKSYLQIDTIHNVFTVSIAFGEDGSLDLFAGWNNLKSITGW
jgi:hypothetical protein